MYESITDTRYPREGHNAAHDEPGEAMVKNSPIPYKAIISAIEAVVNENDERGRMYPQDAAEHAQDKEAALRIIGMLKWYAEQGERLKNWPTTDRL